MVLRWREFFKSSDPPELQALVPASIPPITNGSAINFLTGLNLMNSTLLSFSMKYEGRPGKFREGGRTALHINYLKIELALIYRSRIGCMGDETTRTKDSIDWKATCPVHA
jgi:hypothetical protein